MEFALSHEQTSLQESIGGYLADQYPLEKIRAHAAIGSGHDPALWNSLADLGVPGLLVPEEFGGTGLELLDAALVAQAIGAAAAPAPFVASGVMAPLALMRSGSDEQQKSWLPDIATGKIRIGLGFAQHHAKSGLAMNGALNGHLTGVLDAGAATHLIAYLADGRAVLVDATDPGVSLEMRRTLDGTRPLTDVTFTNAKATRLDAANDPMAAMNEVLDAGRIMLAADTLGAAQTMFDKAVEWAKQRVQFGRVIGSYQGVKYMCSDMATMLEPCHAFVWHAAYCFDTHDAEARLMACQVKAHLDEVGRDVARISTEVHGGMGFTDLTGLHYWMKRIGFNRQVLGGTERCRQEAARLQGWAAA
jgi:alkylation response protein AidB-like acyl-CoA dehydrogenase